MRALRFIALAVILAALLVLPAITRTVPTVTATFQTPQEADQANVAKTSDATWTSGSVDLEGVAEDDTTTYTFSTVDIPDAAKPTQTEEAATVEACTQPPFSEALANGFDGVTNNLIPQGKPLEECAEPVPGTFEDDKAIFEEVDEVGDG